jgi:hypothetical protein
MLQKHYLSQSSEIEVQKKKIRYVVLDRNVRVVFGEVEQKYLQTEQGHS